MCDNQPDDAGRLTAAPHTASTERLMSYWSQGAGAIKVWGTPGDFLRCVRDIQTAITKDGRPPLPDHEIKGLCARLHHRALGVWPGQEHQ
jgi:hypothetical protein